MITNAIAQRYAKALIQLAKEDGAVEKYYDELTSFGSILDAHADFTALLSDPASAIETKKALLRDITDNLPLSKTVVNFFSLLLEKNRLGHLSSITGEYRGVADELSGLLRTTLTSALPLEEKQIEGIKAALEKSTGKTVLLKVEYDPSLIGGVVAKIGDAIFDGSIKTQLDRIQDILQKG
ncbi:MAG: ATP synthase F1 subunit delta [Deltaproteobacteria bacterium]